MIDSGGLVLVKAIFLSCALAVASRCRLLNYLNTVFVPTQFTLHTVPTLCTKAL